MLGDKDEVLFRMDVSQHEGPRNLHFPPKTISHMPVFGSKRHELLDTQEGLEPYTLTSN